MELFKIFGTIALKGKDDFFKDTDEATSKGKKLASAVGKGLATAAKVGVAAVTAAASAVGVLTKQSLDSYAEYEQLVGGVDTLFGDSSQKVQQYAANAYKTAGMSANEYMATVTSFSASLLQSLGGDTEAAASYADQAITDMSDNANKMGTDMGAIQNAYQGFAKQNYTMLDNLKLGYGGTKTEMERLIADANKVKEANGEMADLSIDSFADVTEAIHIIQNEMGITGTTAAEASSTIQGSVSSMKSAWSNLLTGLADDNAQLDVLINNFAESAKTAAGNVAPRVVQILNGISSLITQMAPMLSNAIPLIISQVLPGMVNAGIQLIQSLLQGISQNMGTVTTGAVSVIMMLANALISNLPTIITVGVQIITSLISGIAQNAPQLVPVILEAILTITSTLLASIPQLLSAGIELIGGLGDGLMNGFTQLFPKVGGWIDQNIYQPIKNKISGFLEIGGEFASKLWEGLTSMLTSKFPGLARIFGDATNGTMEEAEANMETWTPKAETAATNAVNAAAEAVLTSGELIPVDAETPVSAMADIMAQDMSMEEAGSEAVNNTASRMNSAVSTAGFDSAGKTAMTKFITGINSMSSSVMAAVNSIANAAVARMNQALQQIQAMAAQANASIPSHALGLNYVPYDNYLAYLHKGEAVLTAEEATAWRAGKASSDVAVVENSQASGGNNSGWTINQYIETVPQTPVEFAAATEAYFEQARWAMA